MIPDFSNYYISLIYKTYFKLYTKALEKFSAKKEDAVLMALKRP